MFCPHCGFQLKDGDAFCAACGVKLDTNSQQPENTETESSVLPVTPPQQVVEEEFIDLSKEKNLDVPRTSAHKGTLLSSIVMVIAWVLLIFLSKFISSTIFEEGENARFLPIILLMSLLCVPIGVVGLIFTLQRKKNAGPLKKLKKSVWFIFGVMTTLCCTFALALGFNSAITNMSTFINVVSWFAFIAFAITFVIITFVFSRENDKEGMYALLITFFISFFPSIIFSYLWVKLLEAAFVAIAILIFVFILFFALGGQISYERN